MIKDIWGKAGIFNRENFISGHLAAASSLHVVQVLEGKEDVVMNLMQRIRKDPRVDIEHEFVRKVFTMNAGWELSMCYSFEITSSERALIINKEVSIENMVDSMKNTYQVKRENQKSPIFHKHIMECILLKYISEESDVEKLVTKCSLCNIL